VRAVSVQLMPWEWAPAAKSAASWRTGERFIVEVGCRLMVSGCGKGVDATGLIRLSYSSTSLSLRL
jgi:hypothetical protein